MSLLVDPNYLLQSLRLDFLTRLPDPLGPGTITFSDEPSPYVALAQLDDPEVWPELRDVRSPEPIRPEISTPFARKRGHGGATGLQYSETIVGKKGTSGAGMRVGGKFRSWPGKKTSRDTLQAGGEDEDPMEDKHSKRAGHRTRDVSQDPGRRSRVDEIMGSDADEDTPKTNWRIQGRPEDYAVFEDEEDNDMDDEADPSGEDDDEPMSPAVTDAPNTLDQVLQKPVSEDKAGRHMASPAQNSQQPPRVAVYSPTDSPGQSPSDVRGTASSAGTGTETEGDDLPRIRQRPTLTQASSFSHDQELSEALRLNDGPIDFDPASVLNESLTPSDEGEAGLRRRTTMSTTDDEQNSGSMWSALHSGSRPPPGASSTEDDFSFVNKGFDRSSVNATLTVVSETDEHHDGQNDDQNRLAPPAMKPRERRRVNISLRAPLHVQIPHRTLSTESQGEKLSPARTTSQRGRTRTSSSGSKSASVVHPGRRPSLPPSHPVQPADETSSTNTTASEENLRRGKTRKDTLETFPITKMAVVKRPSKTPSGLSALMAQGASPQAKNPFTSTYGALAGRGDDVLKLNLFFPHSAEPIKPLVVNVRRDVTVEEVIGFGLWTYWEQKKEPILGPEDAEELTGRMDPANWNLMMAEEDGEVDDDFPALDRMQSVLKVGMTEFGIVEATRAQAEDNRIVMGGIQRRPSRVIPAQPHQITQASKLAPNMIGSSISGFADSDILAQTAIESSTLRPASTALGEPDILLRVSVPASAKGDETVVTAVKVPSNMYLQDVLELICRKRSEHLKDHRDFALLLGDQDIVVPLDRTVQSLRGLHSLRLVRRSQHAELLARAARSSHLRNIDPTSSIFKRQTESVMQPKYISASDVMTQYKEWVVSRKHAMSLTRHDRIFTVDGQYISIRSMQTGRVASYHVSSIAECKPSRRMPNSFKLTVNVPNKDPKRYDFDAASREAVNEVVGSITTGVYQANYEYTPYIAEAWNTLSNFPWTIVALSLLYHTFSEQLPFRLALGPIGIIAVTLGSAYFHATLTMYGQQADELPMLFFIAVQFVVVQDTRPRSRHATVGDWIFPIALSIVNTIVFYNYIKLGQEFFPFFCITFGFQLVASVLRGIYLANSDRMPKERRPELIALALRGVVFFLIAFGFWLQDIFLCEYIVRFRHFWPRSLAFFISAHAWWHLFAFYASLVLSTGAQYLNISLTQPNLECGLEWRHLGLVPYLVRQRNLKKSS